jgi:hypothetical protein
MLVVYFKTFIIIIRVITIIFIYNSNIKTAILIIIIFNYSYISLIIGYILGIGGRN